MEIIVAVNHPPSNINMTNLIAVQTYYSEWWPFAACPTINGRWTVWSCITFDHLMHSVIEQWHNARGHMHEYQPTSNHSFIRIMHAFARTTKQTNKNQTEHANKNIFIHNEMIYRCKPFLKYAARTRHSKMHDAKCRTLASVIFHIFGPSAFAIRMHTQ